MLDRYLLFFRNHERLILVIVAALVLVFFGQKGLDFLANRAQIQKDIAFKTLEAQKETNKQIAADQQQRDQQYQQIVAQVLADNQKQRSTIASLESALVQRQETARTAPLSDVSNRWANLLNASPDNLSVTPNGVLASESISRTTVAALEEIPTDRQKIQSEETIINNDEKEIKACRANSDGLRLQINGLKSQVTDEEVACKKEVSLLNAKLRRSRIKTFVAGFVAGFLVKIFVK